ncbi:MAG: hypothetical protein ACW97Z_16160 [Candidatus Hodarchaeales archaeon]
MSRNIKDIDFFLTDLNMLYSSFKQVKVAKTTIFVLLLTFWVYTAESSTVAVTADWGDVVDVHYFRFNNQDYTGVAEDNEINDIYLTQGSTVPPDILALYPQASADFFTEFKAGIVGIAVGESKQFTALEGVTNYYFEVTVLTIKYDASGGDSETTTTSTTTTTTTNSPFDDIGNIIIFGGGGTIIAGGLLSWAIVSSRRRGRALSSESSSASRRERSIKESKTKLKELRELAESRISDGSKTESEDSTDVKFRRRR